MNHTREESPFISVQNITQQFGDQKVLQGVSFDLKRGELLALIGGSGAGKSVILKHLDGLMDPLSGKIYVDGLEMSYANRRQKALLRTKIGLMFQNGALFDSLSVAENVAFPLRERGGFSEKEIREKVEAVLESVYLKGHGNKMPANLSGGMIKRVAVARAIITDPDCLLYDEPTAGLDPIVTDGISFLIRELNVKRKKTTIIVSHDMGSVLKIADRIIYLREGKMYWTGTPQELIDSDDPICSSFLRGTSDDDWSTLSKDNPLTFMQDEIEKHAVKN